MKWFCVFIISLSPIGEGNGNPPQYSCLENSMGYNLWGCKELGTTEGLHFHFSLSLSPMSAANFNFLR